MIHSLRRMGAGSSFTWLASVLLWGLLALATATPAQAFVPPALTGPVIDEVGVFDSGSQAELVALLNQVQKRGALQLQIVVLKTLGGEPIEQASIKMVDQYKLGTATKDNGVLFLIVPDERKMRIEVGQGLEGDLTDLASKRITSDVVKPFFKAGRYADGIRAGALAIISQVDPEALGNQAKEWQSSANDFEPIRGNDVFELLLFLLFLSISVAGNIFHSKYGRRRGFARGPWSHFPSGGGGSWGGSSGGGWSGGGGGFSGGGASDSW